MAPSHDRGGGAPLPRPAAPALLTLSRRSGLRQIARHEVPIDETIEKRLHKVGATVLVEIVRMLPHVYGEQWRRPRSEVVGVRCGHDLERPAVGHQPAPAAAEAGYRRSFELLGELLVAAPGRGDALAKLAARRTAAAALMQFQKRCGSRPGRRC